jgi:hypothetical protein
MVLELDMAYEIMKGLLLSMSMGEISHAALAAHFLPLKAYPHK